MTDRRLTDAHMRTSYDRGARTGAAVARLGRTYGFASDDFVTESVDLVLAAQADQAAATWSYLSEATEMADTAARILPVDAPIDHLIGAATHDGTPLETVYRRPGKLLAELSADNVDDAVARTAIMAEELATVDVAVAGRRAEAVYGSLDKRVVGWRRVPNASACAFCRTIATRTYSVERLAPAHRSCKCGTEPVTEQVPAGDDIVDRDAVDRLNRNGVTVDTHTGPNLNTVTIPDEIVDPPSTRGLPKGSRFADGDPYILDLAASHGVTPDEIFAAQGRVSAVRQQIRDAAAVLHDQHARRLYQWNAEQIRGPGAYRGQKLPPEYDWYRGLDQREKGRLSRKYFDADAPTPDVFAQQIASNDASLAGLDYEDVIEEWLRVGREYDAAGAMRRGKLPSARAYSDNIDIDNILVDVADDGYSPRIVLGNNDLEAAAHIASAEKNIAVREALDYLGDAATAPKHGPSPYKMSYQAWEDEVRSLEYGLKEYPGEMAANAKERLLELVPQYLDDGQTYEDLYAIIVDTAHRAGEEVPDYARIVWR